MDVSSFAENAQSEKISENFSGTAVNPALPIVANGGPGLEADDGRREAAEKARRVIEAARPAGADHPYLQRKQVRPTDTLRELPVDELKGIIGDRPVSKGKPLEGRILIAPIIIGDAVSSVEFIDERGLKSALRNGRKGGGYWMTGPLPETGRIVIAEGVSTALSIAEALGEPVVAALSVGNLEKVGRALQRPGRELVIAADQGKEKDNERGKPIGAAVRAAQRLRVALYYPPAELICKDGADFNDLHVAHGLDAVRRVFEGEPAVPAPKPKPPRPARTARNTSKAPVNAPVNGAGAAAVEAHVHEGAVDHDAGIEAALAAAERERKELEQREAAERALKTWHGAGVPDWAQELAGVGIEIRAFSDGTLIAPVCDTAWAIHNLLFLGLDGSTRTCTGGRRTGVFVPLGTPDEFVTKGAVLICDDWRVGVWLRRASGLPVAVTLGPAPDVWNPAPAVRRLREWLPRHRMVVFTWADALDSEARNDLAGWTTTVVGLDAPELNNLPDELLYTLEPGRQGDKERLAQVEARVGHLVGAAVSRNPLPGLHVRRSGGAYWVTDEMAEVDGRVYQPGVYFCGVKVKKTEQGAVEVPFEYRISSPITLVASALDWLTGARSVRLNVLDAGRNGWRTVFLPREALASPRYRGELLKSGASPDPEAGAALVRYLAHDQLPREFTTERTGWHDRGWGDKRFVLPDGGYGGKPDDLPMTYTGIRETGTPAVCPDAPDGQAPALDTGADGDAQESQRPSWVPEPPAFSVMDAAAGNPILTASLALAFAGPLLKWLGRTAVLIHLVGPSTTGKTTCLVAANSVWGARDTIAVWRATANGLEQRALAHCDGFLALDEIGQVDARTLEAAVYLLANGTVRTRARADNGVVAAPLHQWRIAALSSGEKTLETLLEAEKRHVTAGQAVRFVEIPVRDRWGAFDNLHGHGSPADFASAVKAAALDYYGWWGRWFVTKLAQLDMERLRACVAEAEAGLRRRAGAGGMGPQAIRVLNDLAVVAAAGELATEFGVTGWTPGTATAAVAHCFNLWARERAVGVDHEKADAVTRLQEYIQRHGKDRFLPLGDDSRMPDSPGDMGRQYLCESRTREHAGYFHRVAGRDGEADTEYLFFAYALKEALRGLNYQDARQSLAGMGVLASAATEVRWVDGRAARLFRVSWGRLNDALVRLGVAE